MPSASSDEPAKNEASISRNARCCSDCCDSELVNKSQDVRHDVELDAEVIEIRIRNGIIERVADRLP